MKSFKEWIDSYPSFYGIKRQSNITLIDLYLKYAFNQA